jgi:hypothetical protein
MFANEEQIQVDIVWENVYLATVPLLLTRHLEWRLKWKCKFSNSDSLWKHNFSRCCPVCGCRVIMCGDTEVLV